MFWIKIILQCLNISFTWLNIKHLWVFKMYLVLFTYSKLICTLLLFSHPVVSDSLGPDRLSMTASLCLTSSQSLPKFLFNASVVALPSHLILWSPLLLLPSIFSSIWDFSIESSIHIRWPKYWSFSFSISPSVTIQGWFPLKLTGLISLLSRDSQESSPAPQSEGINSLAFCLLPGPVLTTIWFHWESHRLDYTYLCWQSKAFAFQNTI